MSMCVFHICYVHVHHCYFFQTKSEYCITKYLASIYINETIIFMETTNEHYHILSCFFVNLPKLKKNQQEYLVTNSQRAHSPFHEYKPFSVLISHFIWKKPLFRIKTFILICTVWIFTNVILLMSAWSLKISL